MADAPFGSLPIRHNSHAMSSKYNQDARVVLGHGRSWAEQTLKVSATSPPEELLVKERRLFFGSTLLGVAGSASGAAERPVTAKLQLNLIWAIGG